MTRLAPSSPREAHLLVRLRAVDALSEPDEFEISRRLARLRGNASDDDVERISTTVPLGSSPRSSPPPSLSGARDAMPRLGAAELSFGRRPSWMRRLVMVAAAPLLFGGFAFAWELKRVWIDSLVDVPERVENPEESQKKRSARRPRPNATLTLPPPAEVPEPAEELQAPPDVLEAIPLDALPTEATDDVDSTSAVAKSTVTTPTGATPSSSSPSGTAQRDVSQAPTATWSTVAVAMRNGDTTTALRDLDQLIARTRGKDREAAELTRAQLWLTTGDTARAHVALQKLASEGKDPLVRARAAKLLGIAEEPAATP